MTKAKPQTLIQLTYDGADGDKSSAISKLAGMAETNKALSDYLVLKGATTVIGELIRSDNAKIFRDDPHADVTRERPRLVEPAGNRPGESSHVFRRIRAASELNILSWTLPSGISFGDATKADLLAAIPKFEKQGYNMIAKAELCRRTATSDIGNKKAREAFTNGTLTRMWDEIENGKKGKAA